ncbi:hypothetical protein DRO69_02705 [Candidatus Bathyarchaeota archaeon]|nr:MAG: hypothetical protein DRO69_02705 [Candidatus Bathyarchaeota archaeon]
MKKAIVTCNINLTDSDGKSLRLLSIAKTLHKIGFKVTLIVNKCYSKEAKKFSIIENGSTMKDTLLDNFIEKLFHYFKQSIKLISFYLKILASGIDCDLIVTSLAGSEVDSLLACILSKIEKVPFIYDYDDPSPELRIAFFGCSTYDPRVKFSVFTRNFLIKNSSLVLTAADTIRHEIIKEFGTRPKIYVWYNIPRIDNIELYQNKKLLRRKLGLKMDAFIISYLGRVPSWGILPLKEMLVRFAENFWHDKKTLFLIIGGGGRWEKYFRKLIRDFSLKNQILITGMKPRKEALEFLAASDVSCIPFSSNVAAYNILPTKLFEAMALGVPIICLKSKNYVNILGEDGIYFDGSYEDFFKKVQWCITNREKLNKISSRLMSRFQREYSWKKRLMTLKNATKLLA